MFDHHVLSKDDIMGEAEMDLQPMINAAVAFGDPELLGDMQIGRWLKSGDSALPRDSAVVVAGDKVKQELPLKLQFTESGRWSWRWSGFSQHVEIRKSALDVASSAYVSCGR